MLKVNRWLLLQVGALSPSRRICCALYIRRLGYEREDSTGSQLKFRSYEKADRTTCLGLFDANCPTNFAPNERDDYEQFLDRCSDHYVVCELDRVVIGAYGLYPVSAHRFALRWILVAPATHGGGIGSAIMNRVLGELKEAGHSSLQISASHKSASFFARFGGFEESRISDGWGPGMHRVEMKLTV